MTDPTHEWTHSTPRVRADGTRIEEGDAFVPTDHEARVWPDRMKPLSGQCTAVKDDGEVCGRDLPCPYHSEEDRAESNDDEEEEE